MLDAMRASILIAVLLLASCPAGMPPSRPGDGGRVDGPGRRDSARDSWVWVDGGELDGPVPPDGWVPVDSKRPVDGKVPVDSKVPVDGPPRPPPDGPAPQPDLFAPHDVLASDTAPSFSDVPPGHPAYTAISWVSARGYVEPCGSQLFCPDLFALRGRAANNIVAMKYGVAQGYSQTPCFTDVGSSHPFFPAVQKLCSAGIIAGTGNGTFRPNDGLTAAEAAAMLVVAKWGHGASYPPTPYYSDVPTTHWAFPYVQKLTSVGASSGCGGGKFCPDAVLQRKWWATLLYLLKTL